MILIIRGHIRETFETKKFYEFIKKIHYMQPDLKIFIHTWNIFANNISWRYIKKNETIVTKEIIYNYFENLKNNIEDIIIDDDKHIQLIGNLNGNTGIGPLPLIGWKNYWYGKYRIIEHIHNKYGDIDEMTINLRFDILNNSNNFGETTLVDFIKNKIDNKFTKNIFLYDKEVNGIDNIYIGNVKTMYKLIHYFFYELDKILSENMYIYNQERLVYRINENLFINNNIY